MKTRLALIAAGLAIVALACGTTVVPELEFPIGSYDEPVDDQSPGNPGSVGPSSDTDAGTTDAGVDGGTPGQQ